MRTRRFSVGDTGTRRCDPIFSLYGVSALVCLRQDFRTWGSGLFALVAGFVFATLVLCDGVRRNPAIVCQAVAFGTLPGMGARCFVAEAGDRGKLGSPAAFVRSCRVDFPSLK